MSYNRENRPSPSVSATLYEPGDRMRGNDGNMYQIVQSYKGTNRWSKLAKDRQYDSGGNILHKVREPEEVIIMLEETGLFQDFMNADSDELRYNIFQNAEDILEKGIYAKGGKIEKFIEYIVEEDESGNGESYDNLDEAKWHWENLTDTQKEEGTLIQHSWECVDGTCDIVDTEVIYAKGGKVSDDKLIKRWEEFVKEGYGDVGEAVEHWDAQITLVDQIQNDLEVDREKAEELAEKIYDKYSEGGKKFVKGGKISKSERRSMIGYIVWAEDETSEHLHSFITDEIGESDWNKGLNKLSDKKLKIIYDDVVDERNTHPTEYKKGGKVEKKGNNEMIIGGLAGFLLGMFFVK